MASAQSGGSCIHILDTSNPGWKEAFKNIRSKGKFKQFIENTDLVRDEIKTFVKPGYQREQLPVYFIEGGASSGIAKVVYDDIKANYRITSYNVCYTKLLRARGQCLL